MQYWVRRLLGVGAVASTGMWSHLQREELSTADNSIPMSILEGFSCGVRDGHGWVMAGALWRERTCLESLWRYTGRYHVDDIRTEIQLHAMLG